MKCSPFYFFYLYNFIMTTNAMYTILHNVIILTKGSQYSFGDILDLELNFQKLTNFSFLHVISNSFLPLKLTKLSCWLSFYSGLFFVFLLLTFSLILLKCSYCCYVLFDFHCSSYYEQIIVLFLSIFTQNCTLLVNIHLLSYILVTVSYLIIM